MFGKEIIEGKEVIVEVEINKIGKMGKKLVKIGEVIEEKFIGKKVGEKEINLLRIDWRKERGIEIEKRNEKMIEDFIEKGIIGGRIIEKEIREILNNI